MTGARTSARSKQLHQNPEIARIEILTTREDELLAAVSGQLIRSGIFQDKAFTEAFSSAAGFQPQQWPF